VDAELEASIQLRRLSGKVLGAIIPRWLFLPGLPEPGAVPLRVSCLPLDAATLRRAASLRRPAEVLLDPAIALRREVQLPKAALSHAGAAVDLQLRQTLPAGGKGLVWRAEVQSLSGGKVDLVAHVLKEHLIAGLIKDMTASGADLSSIRIEGAETEPFWQARTGSRDQAKRWAAFTALAVGLIALALVINIELQRSELAALVEARQERVKALEDRLATATAAASEGATDERAKAADLEMFAQQSRRLGQLVSLTEALPDAVWISELSLTGDQMTLAGFTSKDVAELVNILQGLDWADEVQLNGAVTFDIYSGQNRFDLTLRMAGGEGLP
jgi:Tfp pilus assembly protein PilN